MVSVGRPHPTQPGPQGLTAHVTPQPCCSLWCCLLVVSPTAFLDAPAPSSPRPGVMPSSPPLAAASSMSLPAAAPTTSVFSFSPVNMICAVKQRSAFAPVLRPPSSPSQACPRAHREGLPGEQSRLPHSNLREGPTPSRRHQSPTLLTSCFWRVSSKRLCGCSGRRSWIPLPRTLKLEVSWPLSRPAQPTTWLRRLKSHLEKALVVQPCSIEPRAKTQLPRAERTFLLCPPEGHTTLRLGHLMNKTALS